jgi:hypothetical protein
MPFDKLKLPEEVWEERRKKLQESLRTISIAELNKIAKEHEEEFVGDPWRDEFLRLVTEQPHASFYYAVPEQGIEVFYCRDADLGIWVWSGRGMGPLDANGKRLMKEAISGGKK